MPIPAVRVSVAAFAVVAVLAADLASAQRSRRVDAWDTEGTNIAAPVDLGFTADFFGVTASQVTINANGTLALGAATISPFAFAVDPADLFIQYSTLNDPTILPTGIEAAFRVSWLSGPVDEATQRASNIFQASLFDLVDGMALEFNYESLLFGDDDAFIGYSTPTTSFDLLATLGLNTFDSYRGFGLGSDFSDVCSGLATDLSLACNNFNSTTSAFGRGSSILPAGFDDYFRTLPNVSDPVNGGRAWFFIPASEKPPVAVPEPSVLLLFGSGLLGLLALRTRRKSVSQAS